MARRAETSSLRTLLVVCFVLVSLKRTHAETPSLMSVDIDGFLERFPSVPDLLTSPSGQGVHNATMNASARPLWPLVMIERDAVHGLFDVHMSASQLTFAEKCVTFRFRGQKVSGETSTTPLVLRFPGGRDACHPVGQGALPLRVSFLRGSRTSDLNPIRARAFEAVVFPNLFPGVDLVYRVDGNIIKSEFIVWPGGDARNIRLQYDGATSVEVDSMGGLVVTSPGGTLHEAPPVIYRQDLGWLPSSMAASYQVMDVDSHIITFSLTGEWESSHDAIVIDPVLSFSSFISAPDDDTAAGIAFDSATGSYFIVGTTASPIDFPTPNEDPGVPAGEGKDIFVVEFRDATPPAVGVEYVSLTFLGGTGDDMGMSIAVDPTGSGLIAITGSTESDDFPIVNATQTSRAQEPDAFVMLLNRDGDVVLSTFYGGNGTDHANKIAFAPDGSLWVCGDTTSEILEVKEEFQAINGGGGSDAFALHISQEGTILFASFIGGWGTDTAASIAPTDGGVAVVGTTTGDLPVTNNSKHNSFLGGQTDGFFFRVESGIPTILTYFGGSADDSLTSIVYQANDDPQLEVFYVTGYSTGPIEGGEGPHPVLDPSAETIAEETAFVAKLQGPLPRFVFVGRVGGTGNDEARDIALADGGILSIVGHTRSTSFGGVTTHASDFDVFNIKLTDTQLLSVFLLGGSLIDRASALVYNPDSFMTYIVGTTSSSDFPLKTPLTAADTPESFELQRGFVARVFDGFCSGSTTLRRGSLVLTDGSGEGVPYLRTSFCIFIIAPENVFEKTLTFTSVDLNTGSLLELYKGSDIETATLLASVDISNQDTFSSGTESFTISDDVFLVAFDAGSEAGTADGFILSYYSLYCMGTTEVEGPSAVVTDGSPFDEPYGLHSNCSWMIDIQITDDAVPVRIFFDRLELATGTVVQVFELDVNDTATFLTEYDSVKKEGSDRTRAYSILSMARRFQLDFVSDIEVDLGFQTSFFPEFCQGTYTFTSKEGTISDGSDVFNAAPLTDCGFLIHPFTDPPQVVLNIIEMDIGDGVINVYDGTTSEDELLGVFTGVKTPDDLGNENFTVKSSGPAIFAEYKAGQQARPGFLATYTSATCAHTLSYTENQGSVEDGSGPLVYSPRSDCYFFINPDTPAMGVAFVFETLDLDSTTTLSLYEGSLVDEDKLIRRLTSEDSFAGAHDVAQYVFRGGAPQMLLRFQTGDTLATRQGWSGRYFATDCTGREEIQAETNGTLTDGTDTLEEYVPFSLCQWLLKPLDVTGTTVAGIHVKFTRVQLGPSVALSGEFYPPTRLSVFGGASTTSAVAMSLSGDDTPAPSDLEKDVMSSQALVHFDVMQTVSGGFSATFQAFFCGPTPRVLDQGASFVFDDGSGPSSDYPACEEAGFQACRPCRYLLQPSIPPTPGGEEEPLAIRSIVVKFTFFDISANTSGGSLLLFDGDTEDDPVLTDPPLSGTHDPEGDYVFASSGPKMLVKMEGGTESKAGFTAQAFSRFCDGVMARYNSTTGFITDGSGFLQYGPLSSCDWLIEPTDTTVDKIELTFTSLDVAGPVVYVYDGTSLSAPLIRVVSGIPSGQDAVTLESTSNAMRLSLRASITPGEGFNATFQPKKFCDDLRVITATSGDFDDGSGTERGHTIGAECSWLFDFSDSTPVAQKQSFLSRLLGFGSRDIQVEDYGGFVEIALLEFDLEASGGVVKAYDGDSVTAPLIKTLTGKKTTVGRDPTWVLRATNGPLMLVTFESTTGARSPGFRGAYIGERFGPPPAVVSEGDDFPWWGIVIIAGVIVYLALMAYGYRYCMRLKERRKRRALEVQQTRAVISSTNASAPTPPAEPKKGLAKRLSLSRQTLLSPPSVTTLEPLIEPVSVASGLNWEDIDRVELQHVEKSKAEEDLKAFSSFYKDRAATLVSKMEEARRDLCFWITMALKLEMAKGGKIPKDMDWERFYGSLSRVGTPVYQWPDWIGDQLHSVPSEPPGPNPSEVHLARRSVVVQQDTYNETKKMTFYWIFLSMKIRLSHMANTKVPNMDWEELYEKARTDSIPDADLPQWALMQLEQENEQVQSGQASKQQRATRSSERRKPIQAVPPAPTGTGPALSKVKDTGEYGANYRTATITDPSTEETWAGETVSTGAQKGGSPPLSKTKDEMRHHVPSDSGEVELVEYQGGTGVWPHAPVEVDEYGIGHGIAVSGPSYVPPAPQPVRTGMTHVQRRNVDDRALGKRTSADSSGLTVGQRRQVHRGREGAAGARPEVALGGETERYFERTRK